MSKKKKSKPFSRRDFIKVSAGAVVAAGIGCGGKDDPLPSGDGGLFPGQGGAETGTVSSGMGGGAPAGSGPTVTSGAAAGLGGSEPTGGTTTTGGAGGSEPAASGGAEAGAAGTGGDGGSGAAGSGGASGAQWPLVAMIRDTDWAKATQDAIEMAGGLPDLSGMTVLLKPNIISSTPHPETTNIDVIRGAIQAVKAKNAARIIVGEDGFATSGMTGMNDLGVPALCEAEGAEAIALPGTATETVNEPRANEWNGVVNLYKTVLDADYVINMPVCKTHSSANYSLAIKNWYGILPIRPHFPGNLMYRFAELHLVKQEDFIILDASKAIPRGGPTLGLGTIPAEPNIVVASRDAIAVDITGLCILKQFGPAAGGIGAVYNMGVWEQPQIQRAMQLAFPGWISSPQDFSYDQQGVTEHAEIMAFRNA